MHVKTVKKLAATLIFLFLALTGCGTSTPSKFYMLNSITSPVDRPPLAENERPVSVGVGPVEFAAYLDRHQIVTRINENEVDLAMFHEWAEPLKDNFIRVFVENLSALDSRGLFAVYPTRGPAPINFQLEIEIARLDGQLGGDVLLVARWTIFRGGSNEMLFTKKSTIREPAESPDYRSLVAAESRAVEALSREVAAVISDLSKQRQLIAE